MKGKTDKISVCSDKMVNGIEIWREKERTKRLKLTQIRNFSFKIMGLRIDGEAINRYNIYDKRTYSKKQEMRLKPGGISMTLPGKVTIGYLEEDLPQKAYFRIKPLFVRGDGVFERVEDARGEFPDEGGVRIVPDKNESSRFKARMRTLGRYCALDLRQHPTENDKIRPNKNYNPDRAEFNRNIVYSDVVTECRTEWLMEVVRAEKTEEGVVRAILPRRPGTRRVAVVLEGEVSAPWHAQAGEAEGEYCFTLDTESAGFRVPVTDAGIYTIPLAEGEETEVIIPDNEVAPKPVAVPVCETVEASAEAASEEPAAEAKVEPAAPETVPEIPAAPAASAPVPVRPAAVEPAPARPVAAEPAPVRPASAPEPVRPSAPAPRPARPEMPAARANARLSPREAALLAQTGLNPRRGRSLSEVVDDGWRKSRIDQLGAPVPGNAGGKPVLSPIDRAAETAKSAWALPEARDGLLDELLRLDGFADIMACRFHVPQTAPATGAQVDALNAIEEERLRLLGELDELRIRRMDKRAELMNEVRETHAQEIAREEKRIEALKKEAEARLRAAESARAAQAEANRLLNDASKEAFEGDFLRFALNCRAAELIRGWDGADQSDYARSPGTYEPTAAQMVSDVRRAFECAGRPLDNDEAVNLLVCLALGRFTVLSGPTGCGKSSMIRLLAAALGLTVPGSRRFACLDADVKNAREDARFKALTRFEDDRTLRVVMLDDVNRTAQEDQSRGLLTRFEDGEDESLRVVMTALDDQIGYPLDARLLDRAFLVRLPAPDIDMWRAAQPVPAPAEKTPSLDAIRRAFHPEAAIPGEVEARVHTLLEKLKALRITLSARTLEDMHAYCAAAIPLMTGAPKKALDYAFAQRALPYILATARLDALRRLPELLCDLPVSLALLHCPLPLPPL